MTDLQKNTIIADEQNSNLVTINEKNVYSWQRNIKENGEDKAVTVIVNNQYAVARLANIDAIININKKSSIAMAIEFARIKKSIAEEYKFATVAKMIHSIHDDLSETTINSYRRVGIVFGDLASEIYKWKDEIPQNTSITNLVQAVSLVEIKEDIDKVTQEECAKAVREFKEKYIDTDLLHLLLPLSKLKAELKSIANTIDGTSTEAPSTGAPSTGAPSTGAPSTGAPSTGAPSTEAPSTGAPSTEAPSTEAPSTEVPSTEAPSTEVPSTEAPSTVHKSRTYSDSVIQLIKEMLFSIRDLQRGKMPKSEVTRFEFVESIIYTLDNKDNYI